MNYQKTAILIRGFDPDKDGSLDSYMRYKRGGLHSSAEAVRNAGRHDDTMLIHVNPEEFAQLREMWGDPLINPETGIPEYGFLKSLKKLVKKVAPVLSVLSFVPGLNPLGALGGMLAKGIGSTALGTALGATGTSALANAAVGAGLGGITGGKRGALAGIAGGIASTPGATQAIGSKVPFVSTGAQQQVGRGLIGAGRAQLAGEDPLMGGLGAMTTGSIADNIAGSDFVQQTLADNPVLQQAALNFSQGLGQSGVMGTDPLKTGATYAAAGMFNSAADAALDRWRSGDIKTAPTGLPTPQGSSPVQPQSPLQVATALPTAQGASPAAMPAVASTASNMGLGLAAATAAAQVGQLAQYKTKQEALAAVAANPDQRPVYEALKNFTMCDLSGDFGACLAQNYGAFQASITANAPRLQQPQKLATGGLASVQHLAVGGPGDGQDDLIPAELEDGDFIIPADVVSALGSGSTDAGMQSLSQMVLEAVGEQGLTPTALGASVPALLSNGEFRIPKAAVLAFGRGSIEEGSRLLYDMMEQVRKSYRGAPANDIPPKAKSPLAYMRGTK